MNIRKVGGRAKWSITKRFKNYEQKNSKLKSSYHHSLCRFLNQMK